MKKLNKSKIIIIIAVLVVIVAIILGVVLLSRKPEEIKEEDKISKLESEFEELRVKDVVINYLEDREDTTIDFGIENITDKTVENKKIGIEVYDAKDGLISAIQTDVAAIDPNGTHTVNMVLGGKIEGIAKIRLVDKDQKQETSEE